MDDRQLAQLLRMAAEAERLETGAMPIGVAAPAAGGAWWKWGGMAAAAAVVIGAGLMMRGGGEKPGGGSVPGGVSEVAALPVVKDVVPAAKAAEDPCEGESTVLLALFRRADGVTTTARMAMKDWDSRRGLNDVAEGELIGFAFEHGEDLTPETMPDSVVLLAVTGPTGLVPCSDQDAAHLAACLEQAPTTCGEEVPCYASAALQCLPPGVSVHAEARVVR